MKNIITDEKGFKFAEISKEEFDKLDKIEFDSMFIYNEQIKEVHEILGISDCEDKEYVQCIRNSIVHYYGDKTSQYYNDEIHDFKNFKKYQTKLSAITCALDTILMR